ncbi:MAG: hypothetical protein WC843_02490 [Candidatus Gracilibacteria bacterium]|jgi:hypothetical protein
MNESGNAKNESLAQQLEKKIPKKSAELTRVGKTMAYLRRHFGIALLSTIGATGAHQAVSDYVDILPSAPVESTQKGTWDRIKNLGKDQIRNSDTVKALNEKIKNITSWSAAISAFALLYLLLNSGANIFLGDPTENARNKKIRGREAEEKEFYKLVGKTLAELETKIAALPQAPTADEKKELENKLAQVEGKIETLNASTQQNTKGLVAGLGSLKKMRVKISGGPEPSAPGAENSGPETATAGDASAQAEAAAATAQAEAEAAQATAEPAQKARG